MARTPWESFAAAPILRGNFVGRGRHFDHPCLAPVFDVALQMQPSGMVALVGGFLDVFAEIRRHVPLPWTPEAESLLGDYDQCVRRFERDPAFQARVLEYDAQIARSGAAALMALPGGDGTHARVHRVRLCAAQHEIERMHGAADERPLMLLRLFMDMHLLSSLRLRGEPCAPDWDLARPAPWRFPWYGHLPDMTADIVAQADFLVVRKDRTAPRADWVMLFVNKMIPHPCASRNTRQKIEHLCAAHPEVLDTILDAVLVVLLGNYPGVRTDYTLSFRTKQWVVARMREIAEWPRARVFDWLGRNSQLVFFATKTLFRINLQKTVDIWRYYSAHYNYDTHYGVIEQAVSFAREVLDARVRDGRAVALEFDELDNDTFAAFHTIGTLSFCKLRKGSFMHTIMYLRLRGHLLHAQACIDNAPGCEKHRGPLARFLAFVGDARGVFWEPGRPHPILEPSLTHVLDRFAAFQATLQHDWPCTQLLAYVGASGEFLGLLQLSFVMYETDDTPDNSCDKYVLRMMNEHPRECLIVFYVQQRINHIRSIRVEHLPPHVRVAQNDAVRRRYHISLGAETPPHATRFRACRRCERVYNFIADPAAFPKCNGHPVEGEMRLKHCGHSRVKMVEGRAFCELCGEPSEQMHRDNAIMGLNLKNKNWAFRQADGAMVCLRCDEELFALEGLGRSIWFFGARYQMCSRCGVWTTYAPERDTTYGVQCGCDSRAPPRTSAPERSGPLESWLCDLHGDVTGFACLVCNAQLSRADAYQVYFLHDDGRIEPRSACALHSKMHRRLWDARRVSEAKSSIFYDRKGNLVHQTWKYKLP